MNLKPFEETAENAISLINEVLGSVYLYLMISLSDIGGENPFEEIFGWLLVSTVFMSFLINICIFLGRLINALRLKFNLRNQTKPRVIKIKPSLG